jgi:hypothetical protein
MLQDITSSDPVDQGDEDIWETADGTTERSISSPPASEDIVPEEAKNRMALWKCRRQSKKEKALLQLRL